jgi:surface protein
MLFWSLRALRLRFLDEISWFSSVTRFFYGWCDVRTVERWMLKETADWVYTMVYWTLRCFVCASWMCKLGDVGWWNCYCDSRRFSRGLGWWSDVCNLKNVCLLCAVAVFWSGFNCLLFLRVDCECNRPFCLATVFQYASAFNGDVNQWDVAKVTTMAWSKSIHIVKNDLTWRELMLLWLMGSVGCLAWLRWCDGKVV